MTLECKKELLKYMVLNINLNNDKATIYNLLKFNYFDQAISNIDDLSFSFDIDPQDKVNAKEFITAFAYFINIIKEKFFNSCRLEYNIINIIEANIEEINNYLSIKNDSLKKEALKIIITNFIKNEKYVPNIKTFLEENNIEFKDINTYSPKECEKIANLLSDIVFCQRGRGKYDDLFINIEYSLNQQLDFIKRNRNSKQIEIYKKNYILNFNKAYETMFKNYNSKKKYLKYFQ